MSDFAKNIDLQLSLNLKQKRDFGILKTTETDLSKLNDVIKLEVVRNTLF